ncbi:hypothetical protein ACCO45_013296 [Purpureocillium lilacinum]|uniref:Uncharacterized protein n=1 Tax=Purpureocillium lilacinum TaxID=33203 RepID=A0ACC4DB55_PURLI
MMPCLRSRLFSPPMKLGAHQLRSLPPQKRPPRGLPRDSVLRPWAGERRRRARASRHGLSQGGPPAADVREPGPVIYHIERCVMRDSTLSPPAGAPRHNSDGCADERTPGGFGLGDLDLSATVAEAAPRQPRVSCRSRRAGDASDSSDRGRRRPAHRAPGGNCVSDPR